MKMAAQVQNPSGPSDQLQQLISQIRDLIAESELYVAVIEDTKESCTLEGSQNRHEHMNALIERHVIAMEAVERQLHDRNLKMSELFSSREVKKNDYEEKLEQEVKGLKEKLQLMKIHVEVIGVLLGETAEFELTFKNCQEDLCLESEKVNELSCQLTTSRNQLEDQGRPGGCQYTSSSGESDAEQLETFEDHAENLTSMVHIVESTTCRSLAKTQVDHQVTSESCGVRTSSIEHPDCEVESENETSESDCEIEALNKPDPTSKLRIRNEESGIACWICGVALKRKGSLTRHIQRIHPGMKAHQCDVCQQEFDSLRHLNKHTKKHNAEKPYTCDVCGKKFLLKFKLTEHIRSHTGEEPFTCDVCGKGLVRSGALKRHMATHSEERPYICDVCGKGFKLKCNLNYHNKVHSGGKSFTCDVCGKGFTRSSDLKKHMTTHSEERPYTCHVCGRGFRCKSNMWSHVQRHSGVKPYVCDICGKEYSDKKQLKAHMIAHSGKRPFICEICGHGSLMLKHLKVHMRIHTGEKPFSCDVCGEAFAQQSSLSNHMRKHPAGEKTN